MTAVLEVELNGLLLGCFGFLILLVFLVLLILGVFGVGILLLLSLLAESRLLFSGVQLVPCLAVEHHADNVPLVAP